MLVSIIGKVLALVDGFLGYFVYNAGTVTTAAADPNCGTCTISIVNYELSPCGVDILNKLVCLTDLLLGLLPQLVGAVFAV